MFTENGTVNEDEVRKLTRTYAQAIAGEPILMQFDKDTAHFTFAYRVDLVWSGEGCCVACLHAGVTDSPAWIVFFFFFSPIIPLH